MKKDTNQIRLESIENIIAKQSIIKFLSELNEFNSKLKSMRNFNVITIWIGIEDYLFSQAYLKSFCN
jgi:hypothetical protein